MKTLFLTAAMLLIATPAFADHNGSDHSHDVDGKNVYGTWVVGSGNAHVEIVDCGDGTPCGTISHLTNPDSAGALDDNNPDPELAKKPLIGSRMLWGFEAKKTKWSGGRIYDAESGKDYKSKLQLQDDGTLEIKGCIGPFCQTQVWTAVTPSPATPS